MKRGGPATRLHEKGAEVPAMTWIARRRGANTARRVLLGAICLGLGLAMSGCVIAAVIGGMAQSYRESSTRKVEAEYRGLEGKTYAVIVAADRVIQANHPGVVPVLTQRINERLYDHAGAAGWIPTSDTLAWLLNHPQWKSRAFGELAEALGVERIVFIELTEYRLHDPGNRYEWSGIAAGTVSVIEADGPLPDEFMFERAVRVRFPDSTGFGPMDMSGQQVASVLIARFVDRASWLFYDHQEPYYPDY